MLSRILTGIVGVPLLVAIITLGNVWVFTAFIGLLTCIALVEYFHMAFRDQRRLQAIGVASGLIMAFPMFFQEAIPVAPVLAMTITGLCLIYLFMGGDLQQRYHQLGVTAVGALYLGYLFPHYVLLYQVGMQWVLWVLIVVFVGDTLAYVVGRAIGRRKLYPEISPGKTMAGAVGSLIASVVAGAVAGQWLLAVPLTHVILLSVVLSILGQSGDLFESWIKRTFAAKDAGFIIPGHGGLMDRLDSLIFPGVVSTYYVRFLN